MKTVACMNLTGANVWNLTAGSLMEIDAITLQDLSIFNSEEEFSIFNKLNFTTTIRGKEKLRQNLGTPLKSLEAISAIQETIKMISSQAHNWPSQISNGTIMVIENFFESSVDPIPSQSSSFSAYSYKLLHAPDFSLVKYSTGHCFDFLKGMQSLTALFLSDEAPDPLKRQMLNAQTLIGKPEFQIINGYKKSSDIPVAELLTLGHFLRYKYKRQMQELLAVFAQMDAWYSMSLAVQNYNLVFPTLSKTEHPYVKAKGLYHILLKDPVDYNVQLDEHTNFLFLTGANMAGKSTFIKAIGSAVFLAHLGMGVPAKQMEMCVFDGILSNINVIDNIVKGESYFYNEVQRIKATVLKINDGRNWFILIDELFKGTNVQDAMKCSSTVIEGLLKIKKSLFILSTHLYEIGESLKQYPNIRFNYFETTINGDQLEFNYTMKDGISNDRLGYLILKKEGVVKMLEEL